VSDRIEATVDSSAKRLLSQREAAQLLSIGLSTLKQMLAREQLKSVRIGRRRLVVSASLDALIDALKIEAENAR